MKILLVNPPAYKKVQYIREGRCMQSKASWAALWPPLTLTYLAAILRKKYDIRLIDATAENISLEGLKEIIRSFLPQILVINTAVPSIYGDLEVAKVAKEIDNKIKTIAFGIFTTLLPEETLRLGSGVDYAIVGEPEWAVKDLVEHLVQEKDVSQVRGLVYRENSDILLTEEQDLSQNNLDELPFPARDLIKRERYTLPLTGKPFALVNIGRGCPYDCTFCIANIYYGKEFRRRSIESIGDELTECKYKLGITNFLFWGESFTLYPEYGEAICDEIIKRNLDIQWSTTSRVDTLTPRLLEKMKKAGCILLGLGIESTSQEILDRARKKVKAEKAKEAIALCRKAKIKTMGHFIFGLPGETKKTAKNTIRFIIKSGLDYCQCYCAIPYPKTELYKTAKENDWITSYDWPRYELTDSVLKTKELEPEEVKRYRDLAFRKFYLRSGFIFQQFKMIKSFKPALVALEFFKWIHPSRKIR